MWQRNLCSHFVLPETFWIINKPFPIGLFLDFFFFCGRYFVFPFHTSCFMLFAPPNLPSQQRGISSPDSACLVLDFASRPSCVLGRMSWPFAVPCAYLVICLAPFLSFGCLQFFYLQSSHSNAIIVAEKKLYIFGYTILVCIYLGSRQANICYILISAFLIFKYHSPLLSLHQSSLFTVNKMYIR